MTNEEFKRYTAQAIDDSDALKILVHKLMLGKLQLIEQVHGGGYRTLSSEEIFKEIGWLTEDK